MCCLIKYTMYSSDIKRFISNEFPTLKETCYLDHTGSTLYAKSQIESVYKELSGNTFGNPHSLNLSSKYTSDLIDQTRYSILRHFHTNPEEYSVIFTSSATAALKLVAESFKWRTVPLLPRIADETESSTIVDHKNNHSVRKSCDENCKCSTKSPVIIPQEGEHGTFVYLQDNHTSVLGMRELAKEKGACIHCMPHGLAFSIFNGKSNFYTSNDKHIATSTNSLFVYPGQCNFSGVKYPLHWVEKVQSGILSCNDLTCCHNSKWFCLLDAASYVSTNNLDLSLVKADFVCISFYKMFGYPTGIGALLVKNSSAHTLIKHYFGGGTVQVSLSAENFHVLRTILHEQFEDGTVPFLSIIALRHGFDTLQKLTGNMRSISLHTSSLAQYVHHNLLIMHHANGFPVVELYSDTDYEDYKTQGNIVNFNIRWSNGEYVGFMEVLHMANLHNIHIRTGCFCNPGACQRHLKLSSNDLRSHFQAGHVCGDEMDLINGQPTGSVRVSFGYMSTQHDADRLLKMISTCFVDGPLMNKLPKWWLSFQIKYREKFGIQPGNASFTANYKEIESNENIPWKQLCRELIDSVDTTTVNKNQSFNGLDTETYDSSEITNNEMYLDKNTIDCKHFTLTHIFVYPVKSCGAMAVNSWEICTRGLLYDRDWMIISSAGTALTQKHEPKLCMIKPFIDIDKKCLILKCEGFPPVRVPLSQIKLHCKMEVSLCDSKVCGDHVQGCDCGDEVANWLSTVLNRDGLRLLQQWESANRRSKFLPPDSANQQSTLSLSNQAQFLLINTASVDWLHKELKDVTLEKNNLLERFRSNLVVQGSEPFEENDWKKLRIEDTEFYVEGPCTRCQMICIDQSTGEKTKEPLRTLSLAFRGKMRFGIYLCHLHHGKKRLKISVGNEIKVL